MTKRPRIKPLLAMSRFSANRIDLRISSRLYNQCLDLNVSTKSRVESVVPKQEVAQDGCYFRCSAGSVNYLSKILVSLVLREPRRELVGETCFSHTVSLKLLLQAANEESTAEINILLLEQTLFHLER